MSALEIRTICCIGAGYVGGPTMAVIADKCPQIQVIVVDLNEARIADWNNPNFERLPVYEPGLSAVLKRVRGKNLHFSTEVNAAIKDAEMIFISVNTPTKTKGLGAGQASDLRWVEACARQVAQYAQGNTIVVEKSTLPVRTAAVIKAILEASQQDKSTEGNNCNFSVLSNPEFLAEGTAIQNLESPDRVLIGGEDKDSIESLATIYANWVPEEKILRTNLWSSELSKLTANAFLAQRISSINAVSSICEKTGADVREVATAIGSDSRIGPNFLQAGPGFGGSCFQKDILNLVYLCHHFGLSEVANYWESVVQLNNWQKERISKLVIQKLFGTVTGKKLAILGFAFKANTNDTREAPAIKIAKDLLEEGAQLAIFDPKVSSSQITFCLQSDEYIPPIASTKAINTGLNDEGKWWSSKSIEDALNGADAVLIITEWDHFRSLNWQSLATLMRKPAWVFDTRGVVIPNEILKAGLKLWRIGDGVN